MIKHVVMYRLKTRAEGVTKSENAVKIKKVLEGLQIKVECVKELEVGINFIISDRAWDLVMTAGFDTLEDLDAFKNHPDFIKASEYIDVRKLDTATADY